MAYYYNDQPQEYYSCPPYYETRDGRTYYYAPVPFQRPPPPYFDNYRRSYDRRGSSYDARPRLVPAEEVFRTVQQTPPSIMDTQYYHREGRHSDGHSGGYRVDRRDHHGHGQDGHRNDEHQQQRDTRQYPSQTTVELYVPICCEKCERKLKKHLNALGGVESITTDQTTKKVVVVGNIHPEHVLSRARGDKPESEFWHSRHR